MAIFKCKICGGSLEIDSAQSVATCEYCGTKQTLPKLDNERHANLYDRANHFRRNNDFDKAMGIYENILNEDNTDAEAYWSIVLCRYGIEYVEDPATHTRVPTVNRAQFTSIFDDEDYKSAIANADGYQREIYEAEANAINEIQKGILAISQKEEPFDVFVCYKETDNNGRRTQDSVLATELYHELTREGFKVFFSRITLEDKLGIAYEPCIFAALNSAKVMVVLGTKSEHFNAVWVRNEWSRYLALIKNGAKKTLIPAYRDMDPYDLPEEFSHLQAQDMSKLGFMQDLTRCIKKIVEADAPKATVKETIVATAAAINIAPLLKRAFMFLEDGDFDRADEFCEQVLNQDPENAQAYFGKLMVELHIKRQSDLANCAEPFDNSKNYQKAIRFGDNKIRSLLDGFIEHINTRNKNAYLEGIYTQAKGAMRMARTEKEYHSVADIFYSIRGYKDSTNLAEKCIEYAESIRKDNILSSAKTHIKSKDVSKLELAISLLNDVSGWKDADEQIIICQRKIEELKIKAENERLAKVRQDEINRIEAERRAKRNKKIATIVTPIVIAIIAFVIILNLVIIPNVKYNNALNLIEEGKYLEALSMFKSLEGYKESNSLIMECNYKIAIALIDNKKYEEAISIFETINGYKDSNEQILNCKYKIAIDLVDDGKYEDAISLVESLTGLDNKQQFVATVKAIIQIEEMKFEEGIKTLLTANVPVELTYNTEGGNLTEMQTLMAGIVLSLDNSIIPLNKTNVATTLPSNQNVFTFTTFEDFTGLNSPIRDGYRFIEWILDSYIHNIDVEDAKFCLTLKASWSTKDYTINYDLAGGKIEGINISEYDPEDEAFTLINPIRKGYAFAGWIGTDLLEPMVDVTIVKGSFGDRIYIATWTPNMNEVIFNSNGGVGTMESLEISTGASSTLPVCSFTKEGYSFVGWSTTNGNTVDYVNNAEYKMGTEESYMLYAVWDANTNNIVFDGNGGVGNMNNQQIKTGISDTLLKNAFSKEGYYFIGWSSIPNGDVEYSDQANYLMGTKSIYTLYAVWSESVNKIVFNGNGHTSGTMTDQIIKFNSTSDLNSCMYKKAGYVFIGWSTTPNGDVEFLNNASYTMGTNAIYTLYAVWSPNTNTVTFDSNTGSGTMSKIQIKTDATQSLPMCAFTKTGYTFAGWSTSPNGSKSYDNGDTYTMGTNSSYTLYAIWKVTEYNIVYSLNGGTASNVGVYTINDRILINNPSRDGYVFIGWTGTGISNSTTNLVIEKNSIGNKEFIANWESYLLYEDNGDGYSVIGVIDKYKGIPEIRIPSTYNGQSVTHVKYLSECNLVTNLVIPNSVTKIDCGAATGFSSLKSISLPFTGYLLDRPQNDGGYFSEDVYPFGWVFGTSEYSGGIEISQNYNNANTSFGTKIESQKYYIPNNLTSVYITNKINGYSPFMNCYMIETISVPDDTTIIESKTFYGCHRLKNIFHISGTPLAVTEIGDYAFYCCTDLKTHISAQKVGRYSFQMCYNITEFTFLKLPCESTCGNIEEGRTPNYTYIRVGVYAFSSCEKLSNVYIEDNISKIEWRSYSDSGGSIDGILGSSKLLNSNELATCLKDLGNYNIKCFAWA